MDKAEEAREVGGGGGGKAHLGGVVRSEVRSFKNKNKKCIVMHDVNHRCNEGKKFLFTCGQ